MKKNILSKKYLTGAGVIIGGFLIWYLTLESNIFPEGVEVGTVARESVVEVVNETGMVKVSRSVDLAFERGGKVNSILVHEGDFVEEGSVLMTLNASSQMSDLQTARARLEAEQVRLHELLAGADNNSLAVSESNVASAETAVVNAKRNLIDVTAQQNQLVQNAEKTLRSTGLQAYLVSDERESSSYVYTPPTVSGTFAGSVDGVYTLELYGSNAPSGSSYRVSGLENSNYSVSTVAPTPVGTLGIYVQFPENFAKRTIWEIPIPNSRSSSYLTNLNAYNAIVQSRTLAIASAENAIKTAESALAQTKSQLMQVSSSARDERITAQRAVVRQMEALVAQAQVAYDNMTIKSPFSGVVTAVHTEIGQIAGAGMPAVSVIANSNYELIVNISEVDIAEVSVGDTATVLFDAYDDVTFNAHVIHVATNATLVSGVPVFEVTLAFDTENEMIKDGLTAEIDITTAIREQVIAVPTRSIYEDTKGKFVRVVQTDNMLIEVPITTGLRGSNGLTEVLTGLMGGEKIITFATEDAIAQIKNQ